MCVEADELSRIRAWLAGKFKLANTAEHRLGSDWSVHSLLSSVLPVLYSGE